MNANELLTALRGHETVTFEIRNLGSTTHETKEFEEAVSEIEHALSRSRIRNTAAEAERKIEKMREKLESLKNDARMMNEAESIALDYVTDFLLEILEDDNENQRKSD